MSITTKAYARAGLIGNPSDGYFGKTIAFLIRDFHATVTVEESDRIEVVPSEDDHARFTSLDELAIDVDADDLVKTLGEWSPIPTTYAGGVRNLEDLRRIKELGKGRLDATVGSALDIFGGSTMKYSDAIAFNREQGN